MSRTGRADHAVVLGGSLAGMLAARVLAASFSRVTIVERDVYPRGPQSRRGVPQACHLHVLLMRGLAILKCAAASERDRAGLPLPSLSDKVARALTLARDEPDPGALRTV